VIDYNALLFSKRFSALRIEAFSFLDTIDSADSSNSLSQSPSVIQRLRRLCTQTFGDSGSDDSPTANELASFILSLHSGTNYAKQKGKYIEGWLYERETTEQSTHPLLAEHHASRFDGCNHILELCTGSAGDTLALSKTVKYVTTLESNPKSAGLAKYNLSISGITNVEVINLTAEEYYNKGLSTTIDGIWSDPARRSNDRRMSGSPENYLPSLPFIMKLPVAGVRGIKVSPILNLTSSQLATGTTNNQSWVREWIGFESECREQILWNTVKDNVSDGTTTLINPKYDKQTWSSGINSDSIQSRYRHSSHQSFSDILEHFESVKNTDLIVTEPHNALIRSGNLYEFYQENDIEFLEDDVAYGLYKSDETKPLLRTPFLTLFRIEDVLPFSLRTLQDEITRRNWNSRTELKKRGIALVPDELFAQLSFPVSNDYGTVIITRIADKPIMFLCRRIKPT
jgi:hypothetical protein